jgi:membrane-anchored protein YejM (alkaline phosphatase superfamily)
MDPSSRAPSGRPPARYARPALLWALFHVPIFVALYAPPIAAAVQATPPAWRAWLWPTFVPQAALLSLLGWLLALPLAPLPRVYRFAAPGLVGLATAAVALDSRIYASLGYHLNGLFLEIVFQPGALREAGVPLSDMALFVGAAVAFVALDVWLGAIFLRRFEPGERPRTWAWALAVLAIAAGERVYGAAMVHFAGSSFFAASTVLPLQVPVRMEGAMRRLFGEGQGDPITGWRGAGDARVPEGIDPAAMQLARRPDVLFLVAESLPAEHLDARTMPNLWRRAAAGARFPNHYSGSNNTEYGIFSLLYGLDARKLDATLGAGRRPLLFPALRSSGYALRVLASSCVDWMGLSQTVFGGVQDVLQTWCQGVPPERTDLEQIAAAKRFVEAQRPDQPLFLFMFFFGTHFNYFHEQQDEVFLPEWDGGGGLRATTEPGWRIQNRARNAAHALDRRIEGFLSWVEATRGRAPLVVFTGDHGEEFRQKGRIGHGSQVTREQINVPALWLGPGVPQGVFEGPTSHVDVVPTLFSLLGDAHPPSRYSDGLSMFASPPDRYVVATVGWEPSHAVIGRDLKVRMYAGLGAAHVTDPDDRPLADGRARMARDASRILRALRDEPEPAPPPAPAKQAAATR